MADVTQGLPPFNAAQAQAQAANDRAAIMNAAGQAGTGALKIGAAAADIGTLPVRAVMGIANSALRVPNAFGAGIPYIPEQAFGGSSSSLTPYMDRVNASTQGPANAPANAPAPQPVSAQPLDTAALNAATQGAPAVPAAAAIVPANAASASAVSPKPGGVGLRSGPVAAGTAGTQQLPAYGGAAAAQPYDPNAVGSWQKYQLTQDHTLFDPFGRGDGTPGSIGGPLPGGGAMVNGHFVDPRDAIALGFKQQLAYQQAASNNLLGAIGRSNGLAATTHALAGTIGVNNFAGVQGQGVDALNAATAGITSAGIGANAAMYGADEATTRTGMEVGEQRYRAATESVPLGTVVGQDPVSHMAVPLTTYGQRPSKAGGMPEAYSPARTTPLPAGLKVGAKSVRADGTYSAGGKAVTIKNGQVTGIE